MLFPRIKHIITATTTCTIGIIVSDILLGLMLMSVSLNIDYEITKVL